MGRDGGAFKWALLAPAMLVAAVTLFYPIAQSFWYSLHDWNLGQSPTLGPFVGFDNYVRLLTDDPDFAQSVTVSAIFTVASVTLTITVALALAMLMAGSGRLEVSVRTALVITFAMSPALVGVSWRFLLTPQAGPADALIDTLIPPLAGVPILAEPTLAMIALVLVSVWHWAPYFMLTFVGALATLPHETLEAAAVDGAGKVRIFFAIILPQLWPVVSIAILLKTIFSIKMLEQVITMTRGGPGASTSTVPHLIYETAFRWYDFGYAAAMSYFLALIMMVLAVVYSRLALRRAP